MARKAYQTAVMTCGCGDLRGLDEMHVTLKEGPIEDLRPPHPPAIAEVMCVDCVATKGWDIDKTATMSDLVGCLAEGGE